MCTPILIPLAEAKRPTHGRQQDACDAQCGICVYFLQERSVPGLHRSVVLLQANTGRLRLGGTGQDKSFITNKRTVGASPRGQPLYEVQFNFLTPPNNDQRNRPTLAKQKNMRASFSTNLVTQLLERYFPIGSTILDPHCGEVRLPDRIILKGYFATSDEKQLRAGNNWDSMYQGEQALCAH
jgi:hypothetical protein